MRIVRARRGDCKEISKLRRDSIVGIGENEYSGALIESNSFEGVLEELNEANVFSVVKGGRVIGNVSLVGRQVSGLYVHPDYSGKGIGKRLLKYVEDYSSKRDVGSLYLYATRNSAEFYFKQGYKPIEIAYSFNTKVPLVFVKMEKKL